MSGVCAVPSTGWSCSVARGPGKNYSANNCRGVRRGDLKQKRRWLAKHVCLPMREVAGVFFCTATLRDLGLGSHCTAHLLPLCRPDPLCSVIPVSWLLCTSELDLVPTFRTRTWQGLGMSGWTWHAEHVRFLGEEYEAEQVCVQDEDRSNPSVARGPREESGYVGNVGCWLGGWQAGCWQAPKPNRYLALAANFLKRRNQEIPENEENLLELARFVKDACQQNQPLKRYICIEVCCSYLSFLWILMNLMKVHIF